MSQAPERSDNDRHEDEQRQRNRRDRNRRVQPTSTRTQFSAHSGAVGGLTEDEMVALAIQQSTAHLTEDEMLQLALAASRQM